MGTKLMLSLFDNKISNDDCTEAGIKLGKILTAAGKKSIKNWETVEAMMQKKFEATMAGIKIGLDSDDKAK